MNAAPATTTQTLAALHRGDLTGARELRLTGLDAVPEAVFGLADSLEVLDLSGGTLADLPADFARLGRLRALFLSGNRFARLPPVLGACPALSQIGARGTGLREVPAEALPPSLRWLTLTDNRLERLPDALGERPALCKLLLAGNRLRTLPARLAGADRLELIRLGANAFADLPGWLDRLPGLAWLSWGANPCERAPPAHAVACIPWDDLDLGEPLGEGASGIVRRAAWRGPHGSRRPVAVKLFKGAMTSDGLPERETATCLTAGDHPNLTGGLGRLTCHPEGLQGLVMRLLPSGWRPLAGPPSLTSCTRDVYAPDARPRPDAALAIARGIAAGMAHLHARGLSHGDLYAHNILWDGADGAAVLGDFGAASALPGDARRRVLERIEARAFGILLTELIAQAYPEAAPDPAPGAPSGTAAHARLEALARACMAPDPTARPTLAEIAATLDGLAA